MKRLHAIIHGQVQGVSFRYYCTEKARELGITGWVMNNADGTVEVVAEGIEDNLNDLEHWLHQGSPSARVEAVYITWDEATGDYHGFMTSYKST